MTRRHVPFSLRLLCLIALLSSLLGSQTALVSASTHRALARPVTLTQRDVAPLVGANNNFVFRSLALKEAALLDHVSTASLTKHGRLAGYQTLITRQTGSSTISIIDAVSVFRSSAGAAWEYGTITTHSRPPRGSAALTLPGLGDARRGFTWPRADKVSLQIIFRRGRYNAALTVLVPARYHIQDFVRLARTLDSRIRADG